LVSCLLILSCSRPTTLEIKENKSVLYYKDIERRIRAEYKNWKGTRHVLGGDDRAGIDCSGLVQAIYKNAFHVNLPRTTREQVYAGERIARKELRAGDLVFFKPPNSSRHVGIFLSGNQFIHASKRAGVTISKIDRVYWGKYYWTGRRILQQ
jgi:cell wall-associated NlpC family hydrolase